MKKPEPESHVSPRRAAMRAKKEEIRLLRRRRNTRFILILLVAVVVPVVLPAVRLPFIPDRPEAAEPRRPVSVEVVRYDNTPAEETEGLSLLRIRPKD